MNFRQRKAAMALQRALADCAEVDLTGGVYDGTFCIWPANRKSPHDFEEFFQGVKDLGGDTLPGHGMSLDGGVGN